MPHLSGQRAVLTELARAAGRGDPGCRTAASVLATAWAGLRDTAPLVGLSVGRGDPHTGELAPVCGVGAGADAVLARGPGVVLPEGGPWPVEVPGGWLVALRGSGELLGVLALAAAEAVPGHEVSFEVVAALGLHLAWALERERTDGLARESERVAVARRRLLEDGSRAVTLRAAAEVVAAAAAQAFSSERAGAYVVDGDGTIVHAVGVGVAPELSETLASSLVGKSARDSPVWREAEAVRGPLVVQDAASVDRRPSGFVSAMQFRSYVAIPLLSEEGPLGLVIVGDASRRRAWTPADHDLARQLALEGALVVESARLREAERARLRELTYQATHDGLTGLPNREVLLDRLSWLCSDGSRTCALLLLDLNDFKQVNDTLGHHCGDLLLQEVATRLACLDGVDTVARLGGDEFALVVSGPAGLPGETALQRAGRVAAALHTRLARAFVLDGQRLHLASSTGIAGCPEHATGTKELLQAADVAMYTAKRRGTGSAVYEARLDVVPVDRLVVYSELHRALSEGELRLHFQPKVALMTGRVAGVEALVRWQHPQRGLLGPGEFLGVAEATDLVHPLTAWVLRAAVAQWQAWRAQGRLLDMAVNISVLNLREESFEQLLEEVLAVPGLAHSLVLELTETAVMTDLEGATRLLQRLRAKGVRISLDDFGAGFSSLSQLRRLPVDELKIDRLLVTDVGRDPLDRAVVQTVVQLARHLGLPVVAEGVEDAATLAVLRELRCDYAQGFHLSRPMPATTLFRAIA